MSKDILINIVLFQVGWFACVLGGANNYALSGSIITILIIANYLYRSTNRLNESKLVIAALMIGFIFESLMVVSGMAQYYYGQYSMLLAPTWMILLWPLFATTLNVSMAWIAKLHPIVIGILGAVSAPLTYYAGYKLNAVSYDHIILSLSIISAFWAILLPLLVSISRKYNANGEQTKPYQGAINV